MLLLAVHKNVQPLHGIVSDKAALHAGGRLDENVKLLAVELPADFHHTFVGGGPTTGPGEAAQTAG